MEAFKNHCKCTLCSCDTVLSISFEAFSLKSVLHVNVLHGPGTHATRWLASVHIVFLKCLADFLKNMKICTIPTWKKFSFLRRNPKNGDFDEMNPASNIENLTENLFIAMS